MRFRNLLLILCCCYSTYSSAQFGLSYHQSNLPFIGVDYELGRRILGSLRISTDVFLVDLTPELVLAYKFGKNDQVDPYLGLGIRVDDTNLGTGIVVPFGLNIYPFAQKQFGFLLELSPILIGDSGNVIRGSWGIRYRFGRRNE